MLKRIIVLLTSSIVVFCLAGCENEKKVTSHELSKEAKYIFYYNNESAAGSPISLPKSEKTRIVVTDDKMNSLINLNAGGPNFSEAEQIRYNYDTDELLFMSQLSTISYDIKNRKLKDEKRCFSHSDYSLTYFNKNDKVFMELGNEENKLSFQVNDMCYLNIDVPFSNELYDYTMLYLYYDSKTNGIVLYLEESFTNDPFKITIDLEKRKTTINKLDKNLPYASWYSAFYRDNGYNFVPSYNNLIKYDIKTYKIIKEIVLKYDDEESLPMDSFRVTEDGKIATIYKKALGKTYLIVYNTNLEVEDEIEIKGEKDDVTTYLLKGNSLYYSTINGKFKKYNFEDKKIEIIGDFSKLEMSEQPSIYIIEN